jgi:hypothetical protein
MVPSIVLLSGAFSPAALGAATALESCLWFGWQQDEVVVGRMQILTGLYRVSSPCRRLGRHGQLHRDGVRRSRHGCFLVQHLLAHGQRQEDRGVRVSETAVSQSYPQTHPPRHPSPFHFLFTRMVWPARNRTSHGFSGCIPAACAKNLSFKNPPVRTFGGANWSMRMRTCTHPHSLLPPHAGSFIAALLPCTPHQALRLNSSSPPLPPLSSASR